MYNFFMHKKILIVDDTQTWLLYHKEVIEQLYGNLFEIVLASSAREALNIAQHNIDTPFCLVISDLQMEEDFEPKLAGEWLVENIKNIYHNKHTNFVFISAMPNIEFIAKQHNVDCISKSMLINNKLLLKFMMEKLLPFLNNI